MNVSGIGSDNAVRVYTAASLNSSMSSLSSGKASDNATSVSLSSTLSALIASGETSGSNMQDAMSLLQTSSGYLDSLASDLSMMQQLAVEANSGTLSPEDRDSIESQFKTLQDDIASITSNYNAFGSFDGTSLFVGNSYAVQTGASQGQTTNIQTPDLTIQNESVIGTTNTYSYNSGNVLVSSTHTAVRWGDVINSVSGLSVTDETAVSSIQNAMDYVNKAQASTGSDIASLAASYGSMATYDANLNAALSVNSDVDVGTESMALTKALVMSASQNAMRAQTNTVTLVNLAMQLSSLG